MWVLSSDQLALRARARAVAEGKVALFEDGIPNTITNQKHSILEIRRTSDPMAMTVRERFAAHT